MIYVKSSNITAVELREKDGKTPISDKRIYDLLLGNLSDTVTLFVEFKGPSRYLYKEVPFVVAAHMALADSCGKVLNEKIKKGGFKYEKLKD